MKLPRMLRRKRCVQCGAKIRDVYCDVCGYEIVEEAQAAESLPRRLV